MDRVLISVEIERPTLLTDPAGLAIAMEEFDKKPGFPFMSCCGIGAKYEIDVHCAILLHFLPSLALIKNLYDYPIQLLDALHLKLLEMAPLCATGKQQEDSVVSCVTKDTP